MKKFLVPAVAVLVLVAVGIGAWLLLRGDDEATSRGTCDGSTYELSVENEDDALEVTFELQSTAPGETWEVLVEQEGEPLLAGDRQTDEDGELDIDAVGRDGDGDEFTVTATPAEGEPCTATLTR